MTGDRLASGAAALGSQPLQQDGQQMDTALVFVNDYRPGVSLEVVNRLQQPTVNQILGAEEEGEEIVDPTDYNGYIYNYTDCGAGNYNLVFLREGTLQQDQTYSFQMDATFFSNRLQLLETGIQTGGGAAADGAAMNETDEADGAAADNETADVDTDNETAAGNVTEADNATETGNDTVEVTNVTAGNTTAGNETG